MRASTRVMLLAGLALIALGIPLAGLAGICSTVAGVALVCFAYRNDRNDQRGSRR